MTPKGHNLVFVIPKILKELQTYHMFYKMEEKGESIHAELNDIERKIWCIRKPSDKLWKYIERYELRNILEIDIVNPLKHVNKTSTCALNVNFAHCFVCHKDHNKCIIIYLYFFLG